MTVIGTGKYAGEKTVYFKINKADLSKNTNAELTEAVYYTGYTLKPQFVVKTVLNDNTSVLLEAGKDYTIM